MNLKEKAENLKNNWKKKAFDIKQKREKLRKHYMNDWKKEDLVDVIMAVMSNSEVEKELKDNEVE